MFAVIKTADQQNFAKLHDRPDIAGDLAYSSTSSGTTRYCRPPVLMTANIV